MSFVGTYNESSKSITPLALEIDKISGRVKNEQAFYQPSKEWKEALVLVRQLFTLGYLNMYTPRVEFNDLSMIQRTMVDQMAFNTYQPNNGEPYEGDALNSWRSNAIRPVERDRAISIAGHATATLSFPKVFAWDEQNDVQEAAAEVLEDLMEWAAEQSNYQLTFLYAVISALVNPVSYVFTEYCKVDREVKGERKEDGTYETKIIEDEILSGFKDTLVSPDELYFENFYEPNIQKQGWLIWRRVVGHAMTEARFKDDPNWKYVKPGVQTIYNDANQSFYYVYDPNMRQYDDEWVILYHRNLDLRIEIVNGVGMGQPDQANPRQDKLFPFTKFGWGIINNRCFAFKSLIFHMMHDANIINTLYPMIIDGTYLNLFPPVKVTGDEKIDSDVIVPGKVSTFANPQAQIDTIKTATDLKSGMDTLFKVEESINQSSDASINARNVGRDVTAYEIRQRDEERKKDLNVFMQQIADFVKQYGRLRIGDIFQYLTLPEAQEIAGNPELIYKTFLVNKGGKGMGKVKKIELDGSLPDEMDEDEELEHSYDLLQKQGGLESKNTITKVNPRLFRMLKYQLVISPDIMYPLSEEAERAFNFELYDRSLNDQSADHEAMWELALKSTPTTRKDPKKYIAKQPGMSTDPMSMMRGAMGMQNPPSPVPVPGAQQVQAPQPQMR